MVSEHFDDLPVPPPDPEPRDGWATAPPDPDPVTAPAPDAGPLPPPTAPVREEARRAIEALVLVAEEPLPTNLLAQLLELAPPVVDALCRELAGEYATEGRGFQLVRVAGGWRYQSHPDAAPYVERFVLDGQSAKLSAAALETLAIIAYKQPISRAQVASIRGVSVDGVVRTLQQRGYIAEVARDPGPGQAVLYGTTRAFLEQVGLDDLEQLPPLGEFVPTAGVVEQLEQGLRPEVPLSPLDDGEEARARVDRFLAAGDDEEAAADTLAALDREADDPDAGRDDR
jgi:segregation and condensation protein B